MAQAGHRYQLERGWSGWEKFIDFGSRTTLNFGLYNRYTLPILLSAAEPSKWYDTLLSKPF